MFLNYYYYNIEVTKVSTVVLTNEVNDVSGEEGHVPWVVVEMGGIYTWGTGGGGGVRTAKYESRGGTNCQNTICCVFDNIIVVWRVERRETSLGE